MKKTIDTGQIYLAGVSLFIFIYLFTPRGALGGMFDINEPTYKHLVSMYSDKKFYPTKKVSATGKLFKGEDLFTVSFTSESNGDMAEITDTLVLALKKQKSTLEDSYFRILFIAREIGAGKPQLEAPLHIFFPNSFIEQMISTYNNQVEVVRSTQTSGPVVKNIDGGDWKASISFHRSAGTMLKSVLISRKDFDFARVFYR